MDTFIWKSGQTYNTDEEITMLTTVLSTLNSKKKNPLRQKKENLINWWKV